MRPTEPTSEQQKRVLAALRIGPSCLHEFGSVAYVARNRVGDLRKLGWNITATPCRRHGHRGRVAMYTLVQSAPNGGGRPAAPLEDRYWPKVDRRGPEECWPWIAALAPNGYGHFNGQDGSHLLAHRIAYQLANGPIPEGLTIDHLCRNRACCNPAHLEAVLQRTNTLRGTGFAAVNATKTHCPQGHEYSPENTYVSSSGERSCRACGRASCSRYGKQRRARKALSTAGTESQRPQGTAAVGAAVPLVLDLFPEHSRKLGHGA